MNVQRDQVPAKYKWDLTKIFINDEGWEKAFNGIVSKIPEINQAISKMDKDIESFIYAIELESNTKRSFDDVRSYAHLKVDEDRNIDSYQKMKVKSQSLLLKIEVIRSSLKTKILSMNSETIQKYIAMSERLNPYKRFLNDILRWKPHTLSDKEEKILSGVNTLIKMPEQIFNIVNETQIKFPVIKDDIGNNIQLSNLTYQTLMFNNDRQVRKKAYEGLYSAYSAQKQVFGTTLSSYMKANAFTAKTKKFDSAIEMALFEEKVNVDTYYSLIKAIRSRIDVFYRYLNLKKKCLGYNKLHMYDIQVPIVKKSDMKIEYDELKKIALDVLEPLGEEYLNDLQKGFINGWFDVIPSEGKCFYPYSTATYNSQPYVNVNYDKTVLAASVWIHELGHAMHYYYSFKNQPYPHAMFSIFTAEVVSILNENLFAMYLIKNAKTKAEKLQYINHFLDQFRIAMFRQAMSAEFEKISYERIEKGEALTGDNYCKIYRDLNKFYYGDTVVTDDFIALDWSRIPHMYSSFYLYKYATGFSAAVALAKDLIDKKEGAKERYLELLKSGGSDFPIEQLKKAGVDMSTTKPVEQALVVFESLLKEFEELLRE